MFFYVWFGKIKSNQTVKNLARATILTGGLENNSNKMRTPTNVDRMSFVGKNDGGGRAPGPGEPEKKKAGAARPVTVGVGRPGDDNRRPP